MSEQKIGKGGREERGKIRALARGGGEPHKEEKNFWWLPEIQPSPCSNFLIVASNLRSGCPHCIASDKKMYLISQAIPRKISVIQSWLLPHLEAPWAKQLPKLTFSNSVFSVSPTHRLLSDDSYSVGRLVQEYGNLLSIHVKCPVLHITHIIITYCMFLELTCESLEYCQKDIITLPEENWYGIRAIYHSHTKKKQNKKKWEKWRIVMVFFPYVKPLLYRMQHMYQIIQISNYTIISLISFSFSFFEENADYKRHYIEE